MTKSKILNNEHSEREGEAPNAPQSGVFEGGDLPAGRQARSPYKSLRVQNRIGFCPFAVLGDPSSSECIKRIKIYLQSKPDFLELGMPFSDPTADGPIIQGAAKRALANGMRTDGAFKLIKKIRTLTKIPIGLLVYTNTVFKYGIEAFYAAASRAGATSILIADLPLEESAPYGRCAQKYGLDQIFLVSEYTDEKRLRKIEKAGSGFLYLVSSLGVTGKTRIVHPKLKKLIAILKRRTGLPLVVGFGIESAQSIRLLKKAGADGVIVGSFLVETKTRNLPRRLKQLF